MPRKIRLNSEKKVEEKRSSKDKKQKRQKEREEHTKQHQKRRRGHPLNAFARSRGETPLLVSFSAGELDACSLPSNVLQKVGEPSETNQTEGCPEQFLLNTTLCSQGEKTANHGCKESKEGKRAHSLIEKPLDNGEEIKRSLDSADLKNEIELPPSSASLSSSSSPLISISTPLQLCFSTSFLQNDRTLSTFSNSSASSFVPSTSNDVLGRNYPSPPSTPPLRAVVSPGSCKGNYISPSASHFASTRHSTSRLSRSPSRSSSPLPSFFTPLQPASPTFPLDASLFKDISGEKDKGDRMLKCDETMRKCGGRWYFNDIKKVKEQAQNERHTLSACSLCCTPFCSCTVTPPRTTPAQPSTPSFPSFASVLPPNLRRMASFSTSPTGVLDGEVPPGPWKKRKEEEAEEEKECSSTTSATSETSHHSSRHGFRHRENSRSPSPFKPAVGEAVSFSSVLSIGHLPDESVMRSKSTENNDEKYDKSRLQSLFVTKCRRGKWREHEEENNTVSAKGESLAHFAEGIDGVAMKTWNEEHFDDIKRKRRRNDSEPEKVVCEESVQIEEGTTREQTFHLDAMTWISGGEEYQRKKELPSSSSLFALPPSALPLGSQVEQERGIRGKMERGDTNPVDRDSTGSTSESSTPKRCCSTPSSLELPKHFSQLMLPASSSSTAVQEGHGFPEGGHTPLPLVSPLLVPEQPLSCSYCGEDDGNSSRIQRQRMKSGTESDEESENIDDEEKIGVEHYLHQIARAAKSTGFANTGNDCYACSVACFLVHNTVFSEILKRSLEAHLPAVEKRWKRWMTTKVGGPLPPPSSTEKLAIENEREKEENFAIYHGIPSYQNAEEEEEHIFHEWAALYPAHSAFRLFLFEVEQREFLFSVTMRLLHQQQCQRENRQRWEREHAWKTDEEVSALAHPFHSSTPFSSSVVGTHREHWEETYVSQCPSKLQAKPTYSNDEQEEVQEKYNAKVDEKMSDEMTPLWYLHLVQRIIGMPQTPLSFTVPSPLPSSSERYWEHPPKKKRPESSLPFDCKRNKESEGRMDRKKEKQNGPRGEWSTGWNTTVMPTMMEEDESQGQTGRRISPHFQQRLKYAWMRTRQALRSIITSSEFSAFQKGISLAPLCRAVRDDSIFFSGYQEDAHEFFVYLMNLLEKEVERWAGTTRRPLEDKFTDDILPSPPRSRSRTTSPAAPPTTSPEKPESTSSSSLSSFTLSSDAKLQSHGEIQDVTGVWICKLIQGQLLNLVRCRNAQCQHETVTVEPFVNLGFSLPSPSVNSTASTFSSSLSIQSLLVETLKYEALDGYFCDKCQSSLHQFQGACFFGVPPPLLVFQVKRFTAAFDELSASMVMSKNTTPVALSDSIEVTALTDKKCVSDDAFVDEREKFTGKSNDKYYYYYNEEQKVLHDALHRCECDENAKIDFLKASSQNQRPNNIGEKGYNETEREKSEEIALEGNNGALKKCKNVHALKGKYRLQSIVEHHGSSLQCGHYTCSFKTVSGRKIPTENRKEKSTTRGSSSLTHPVPVEGTQIDGTQEAELTIPSGVVWYKANDKMVTAMNRNAIQSLLYSSTDCYLVLYERCSLQETVCPINDVMPSLPPLV